MNWSDEHYVKLYTRDTLTWKTWCWQTRTVLMHMLRKCDGSGFLEVGQLDPILAVSVQLELPAEVVRPGLEQLLASGTAEIVDGAVLLPKFVEAQEARKSDAQKKQDQRERNKAKRRSAQRLENRPTHVTECHPVSPAVTETDPPSPALPAQPSSLKDLSRKKPRDVPKKPERPPDPRHAPLVAELCERYQQVTHAPYGFSGADAKYVTELLGLAREPAEVVFRWETALRRKTFPLVRSLGELVRNWNHFPAIPAGEAPEREMPL